MSVILSTAIDIQAPASDVWAVLADFPTYGEWSTFSKVDGIATMGSKLAMRMPGFNFGSTVTTVRPNEELEWSAQLFNAGVFNGAHTFTLTSNPDGTTRLTNTETFSGWLLRPFEGFFKHGKGSDGGGYASFNQALKKRVEAKVN
jgi:hypothetical protein